MSRAFTPLELVELVAAELAELRTEVVFVGGAITGLLLTDPAAPSVSSTKDVDVIVSVTTPFEYLERLSGRMRSLGFRNDDDEDAPICRWRLRDGIKLDLMPTEPHIIGFSNRWFPAAFQHAQPRRVGDALSIRVVTAPYFVATKLEAFASRGKGDYMGSKDIEDVCAVIHGRAELVGEVAACSDDLRAYLGDQARALLANHEFLQSLEGHLPGEDLDLVKQRLAQLAS